MLGKQLDVARGLGFYPMSLLDRGNKRSFNMLKKINVRFIANIGDYILVGGKNDVC